MSIQIAALAKIIALLPATAVKQIADVALDTAENFVGATKTEIDDAILLPAIGGVRAVFGIADNDEPAGAE